MRNRRGKASRLGAVSVLAAMLLVIGAPAAWADVDVANGSAYGESVDVLTVGQIHVVSGPLPRVALPGNGSGGNKSASLASVDVPDLLRTGLLEVHTEGVLGPSGFVESSADVANVSIGTVASPFLTATAVHSECRSDSTGSTGSTTLVGASIVGVPVEVNPAPNTTIPVPGIGSVILNEQTGHLTGQPNPSGPGGATDITVNAIHVVLNGSLGTGDIIISQSRCAVRGSNVVIPIGMIGLIGLAMLTGIGFAFVQRRRRRAAGQATVS